MNERRRSYNYSLFGKQVNTWLNDETVEAGITKYNIIYLRDFKEILGQFKKNNAMLYFILTNMKMNSIASMFNSSVTTTKFLKTVVRTLKVKKVTKAYTEHFNNNIAKLRKRLEHIDKMIKENLYITEYYPFFVNNDSNMLYDFENNGNSEEVLNVMLCDFEKWKLNNADILAKHIAEMTPIKEIHDAHVKKINEIKQAEKEARKLAKKEADDEVREIRNNEKKYKQHEKAIERSFNKYYYKR